MLIKIWILNLFILSLLLLLWYIINKLIHKSILRH